MRISTNTIYQSGTSKLSTLQSDQAKLQQQIATGRRILNPSDNPIASARALEVSHEKTVNTSFADTRKIAQLKLNTLAVSYTHLDVYKRQANTNAPGANGAGLLTQGYVETSNVNVVEELVNMIQTQRAYEINSKAITTSDQMLQKLTQM